MKADRLLSALLLLQAKGRVTGRELAERLEVSERTVHRDMEALSAAKVPISALRGAQGGWQLEPGWRTHVPGLDEAELRALLMIQPRALSDPALIAASERAFGKLMAALPTSLRKQAAAMSERLHVDGTGWHASSEDLSMLPIVQDAVARDCKLTFDYTRADGQAAPRTVDPLGLVAKGTTWYLVARAPNGMRTYRISRMRAATPLASTFKRPSNFKLASYWKKSTAELERQRIPYNAVLTLHPTSVHTIRNWCATLDCKDKHHSATQEGWATLNVRFEDIDQARFIILGLGSRVQVHEPEDLRQCISTEAAELLRHHPAAETSTTH
ncbi:MAG: YafY family transcriptional regulator [Acidobacteriota bacterium]|nr:YafY family transcriptional regulator [Acidobacteriota bacterium]